MSWHTSAIFIQQPQPADLETMLELLGIRRGKIRGKISFEDATRVGRSGKSVAHVNGWTVVCDSSFFFSFDSPEQVEGHIWTESLDQRLREISSRGSTIFGFVTEGGQGIHGFTLYRDGNLVRMWLVAEGELITDQGAPLPEEDECFESGSPFEGEEGLLLLMEKLCVPFDVLEKTEFQAFA